MSASTVYPPEGVNSASPYQAEILGFQFWMKKEGYSPTTIESRGRLLRNLARNCELLEGERIKEYIANSPVKGSTKLWIVQTYHVFAKWKGLRWEQPKVQNPEPEPIFIPLESELDALIAGSGKQLGTILQTAKETGARAGEILRMRWLDLDTETRVLDIRTEKGSHSRKVKVSPKLVAMLNMLPKDKPTVFGRTNARTPSTDLGQLRRRLAAKLQNPRLLRIHMHTFRHWYATMLYHRTRDILFVKQALGHKSIQSTLRYTHLVDLQGGDQFTCKVAKTVQEASSLIEAGFDYVTEVDGVKLFRKRE